MPIPPDNKAPPPKDPELLKKVRKSLASGTYLISSHAQERMNERNVVLPDVMRVLKNGYHESSKDAFDDERKNWKYAVRGQTIDGRDLRVVVKIAGKLMVITVIDKDN